ncbi:MAG: sugar phosphate isomerase/epimerase [Deltaproteobacteria bacterium]|jgi:sugar phosphate isomerase/epimerase|nr:sugar phosphate isomerase/epimerase [Deltaproteobacteria bacterium]
MPNFATLYFSSIFSKDSHFEGLKKLGYFPEIYFESGWNRIGALEHREIGALIQREFGGCSVHLPYGGLYPGEDDGQIPKTLQTAASIAQYYQPIHLIGHAVFRATRDSAGTTRQRLSLSPGDLAGPACAPKESFLANSRKAWTAVLAACDARLFLENTQERSPFPIAEVLRELPPERASMCFDVGHWHYAGMGSTWRNLEEWLEIVGPRLGHLHLHDNDGSADQHRPLGQGLINFQELGDLLRERDLKPTFTIENHDALSLAESVKYLAENPLFPA